MNITHLLIDLETLGKKETTVILSAAIVPFVFEEKRSFIDYVNSGLFVKFNAKEQIKKYSRTVDKDVVDWWGKQTRDARDRSLTPSSSDVTLEDGLDTISRFIGKTQYNIKSSFVWSRGIAFDLPKFESLYEQSTLSLPINTWKARDTRTFIDVLTGSNTGLYTLEGGTPKEFIAHDCLHDCAIECLKLVEIYNKVYDIPF